jgi:phosphinothricin acetyltransferase
MIDIRLATAGDLPAIRDIYNHYVLLSTCTFQLDPDSEQDRLTWFVNRGPAHPVTVAAAGGAVIGWGALSPWRPRAAYARSAEASVYVHHEHHRRGIGRALLADLIERARASGVHTILGVACTEHPASIALQEAFGFRRVGSLHEIGFKFGRWLDVAYLQLMLSPTQE